MADGRAVTDGLIGQGHVLHRGDPEGRTDNSNQALEGERLSEVSEGGGQANKMVEVAGLAAAIADRILEQHEAGISVPPEQFTMLVRAARMLLDNGVTWPPSVEHVVMEIAKRVEDAKSASAGDDVGRT